ncbi:hypothetical protein M427DRAFT_54955 [Gonapodya prolifera JEL478]|uniref:Uncharacterized protein n=1 Tax=Gonapodya prolifera (strain JEL478) TaxID=1344416 RepID=A0A139AJE6_GONPJ|nr:hypothetical protein M427DRAFT_54955 [Gonapodya prolifera JEL478]|eukprot:KXS16920.1 hypothetical protein M427DRAFT_54955 [Gonapodya prolifera JEL478]
MNLYSRLPTSVESNHSTDETSNASNLLLLRLLGLPDPPSPFPPPQRVIRDMVYEHLKAKRGTVWPNQGFWRQLEAWESRLARRFVEKEM